MIHTAQQPAAPTARLIDPAALMRIRNLEMRARVVVEGFWHGMHRSPYHGFSVEFTEYRQYSPGDDPRYLDWRLFARSDRYYIKKFEDETNLRCHLIVDTSRSMTFGSLPYSKSTYANTLAATLGYFLYMQGDAVGLLTFADRIRDYLPARNRSGHLRHLMLALERPAEGADTDVIAPLKRIAEIVSKRGLMVVISDLLANVVELDKHLGYLAAAGHEVVVFQVLDPAELRFEFDTPIIFRDVETGRELFIDPSAARKRYMEAFAQHNQSLAAMCRGHGIEYHQSPTDQPLELALFDFLRERMRRAPAVSRHGSKGGRAAS